MFADFSNLLGYRQDRLDPVIRPAQSKDMPHFDLNLRSIEVANGLLERRLAPIRGCPQGELNMRRASQPFSRQNLVEMLRSIRAPEEPVNTSIGLSVSGLAPHSGGETYDLWQKWMSHRFSPLCV